MSLTPRPPPVLPLRHSSQRPLAASSPRPLRTTVGELEDVLATSKSRIPKYKMDEKGVEQLRSELQVAQLRLTMAEGQRYPEQPLSVLLAGAHSSKMQREQKATSASLMEHLERLRADCAHYEDALAGCRSELRASEDQRRALEQGLSASEATATHAQKEWQQWQQRCMGFERECAAAAMRTDTVTAELQTSRRCQQDLEAAMVQQRLRGAETENAETEAWVQARGFLGDSQKLERSLAASACEIEVLRAEVQEAQANGFRAQGALTRLEREHGILKEDRDAQHSALAAAMERNGALASRCESLEAAVAETATAAVAAPEVRPVSSPCQMRQVTSLLGAANTGALEPRSPPGQSVALPATSPATLHRVRPPASPRSRWDYPKCAAARELRAQILLRE